MGAGSASGGSASSRIPASRTRTRGSGRSRPVVEGNAWVRFRHDVRDVRERFGKQTSKAHKRFVFGLIMLGALLRAWFMYQPITASEAAAYMGFASGSFSDCFSDYSLPINHVLHTALSKITTGLFGIGLFALRFPAFLAGVLVLPLFYLFVRSMFNRYIALMALAMAAGSPGLIGLSALAHGYSVTWLFLLVAFIMGRHLVRDNNAVSGVFMGLACAFAMWAVPTALTAVIMVYLWVLFTLLARYERSLSERTGILALSLLVFIAATLLLYLPVIMTHGLDQLFQHSTSEQHSWKEFSTEYVENVLALWVWIVDPLAWWLAIIGFLCLVHAAYISAKYRTMLFALFFGAVPLTLVLANGGEPWRWAYALFFFHLGMAITLFYLLKAVQDRVWKNLSKRTRTAWASVILVLGFSLPGLRVIAVQGAHVSEAAPAAKYLREAMVAGDGLCLDATWEAAVAFELLAVGSDPAALQQTPASGRLLFTVLAAPNGPDPQVTMQRCEMKPEQFGPPSLVKDWERMEIFAARMR